MFPVSLSRFKPKGGVLSRGDAFDCSREHFSEVALLLSSFSPSPELESLGTLISRSLNHSARELS